MTEAQNEAILVDILLPTYNGTLYLKEMAASLRAQSHTCWRLLVRDDGSGDGTPALLRRLAAQEPRLAYSLDAHVGVVRSMDILLGQSSAPYFLPADQDDIWLPEKIAVLLGAMRTLERQYGASTPLLAYSDADLVDERGERLGQTFRQRHAMPTWWGSTMQSALVMSPAPGCTMLGNAALRQEVLPLPEEKTIFMHDWWIFLCAFALGRVVHVPQALVLYRQHANNALGAKKSWSLAELPRKTQETRQSVLKTQRQAAVLLDRHRSRIPEERMALCSSWAKMPSSGRARRIARALSDGFCKPGFFRRAMFYITL